MKLDRKALARREVLLGAGGVVLLSTFLPRAFAEDKSVPVATPLPMSTPPAAWQDAIKAILGEATPLPGKIAMDVPEIAENGNTVPFNISVESPMSEAEYVKALHIVSTGNPLPQIGAFEFSPQSGKAQVSSRMRLGKTQEIVALAQMSDGKFYMTKRTVKVTIGGCGG